MKVIANVLLMVCFSLRLIAQDECDNQVKAGLLDAYLLSKLEVTKLNATIFYRGMDDTQNHVAGFFPIKEGGCYKCIYWRADPVPEIYATVSLTEPADIATAVLDTTVRQFNDEEAAAFRICDAAFIDFGRNMDLSQFPKPTYTSFIPLISKQGKRVYVDYRADRTDRMLFGNDVVYTFDDGDRIISRVKAHKKGTEIVFADRAAGLAKYGKWFHSHEYDALDGLSVADLATVFLYSTYYMGHRFLIKDRRFIYMLDLGREVKVSIYTHANYDKIFGDTNGD